MVRRASSIYAALSIVLAAQLVGQQDGAEAAARAGARAVRVSVDPFPVTFSRGDSLTVRVGLLDSIGSEVSGARWSLVSEGRAVVRHRVADSSAATRRYVFLGEAPGTQVFWVEVERAGADGRTMAARVDSLVATVADWQVARIEIMKPEFAAYSGTTIQLRAKVYSRQDAEIENPNISWDTDDPCHARIMPDGAISFGAPAKITVKARSQGKESTREIRVSQNPVSTVDISPRSAQTRVGDVVRFRVGASDRQGKDIRDVAISYTVASLDSARGTARIDGGGYFVAEKPGSYVVRVAAGDVSNEALVEVARRPGPTPVQMIGRGTLKGVVSRGLAVFTGRDSRDYAYTGSQGGRIYAWDVTDPANVKLTDSLSLDAGLAGDIRISGDGGWAAVARSGSGGNRNGVSILDLSAPAHPSVIGSLSDSLAGGVRSLWIAGNTVYAVNMGAGALEILDLSTPAQPRYVGRWETRVGRSKELHDVWGDDKNLYLAYGTDGLIILDVSDVGTPTNPRLVSQLKWDRAAAHAVTRSGRYAFVGEEIIGCPECVSGPQGAVRIIDVTRIKEPVEVARYEVPEAGPDDLSVETSTLFGGFRQGGVRMVDIAGELRGDLYREGRQAGWFMTTGDAPASASSAVSFKGYLYVVDAHSGLWVLRHQRAARLTP